MATEKVIRELSIFVNDRQVVNSMSGINREIRKVNNEIANLNRGSATYDADLRRLSGTLSQLRQRQSEFREEIQDTNMEMGAARETFGKIFTGIATGDMAMAREGINGIRGSIMGATKAALAFIATPIGAAIAAIVGIAAGTKAIFDFNMEAEKSARLIENLSGKTGEVVEAIRIKMKALADTFEVSFESLAAAVDNLVDTGVAKDEFEALEKIKQGLLTAPDKNEFISSLESSAVTAKQVGLQLEEVIALKKAIEETGVDPEKVFGALQKAGLNLSLQTDELRKKMSAAFGAAFTDDVLAKVKTGQISVVQALDQIDKKSKEVNLNQTQQAELGKEIFGKSAIAAGGYASVLDTVAKAQDKQKEGLNANQKALDVLATANERYNKVASDLFRIEGFGSMWDMFKAGALDALSSVMEWLVDLKDDIQPLIDLVAFVFSAAWISVKNTFTIVYSYISASLKIFSNTIGTVFNFIKKLLTGDFKGALDVLKNGLLNFQKIIDETFGKIKNSIINAIKSIVDLTAPFLDAIGLDVDKIKKKLDGLKSKEVTVKTKTETDADPTGEKANTKATQDELAAQQKIRDEARAKEEEKRRKAAEKLKAEREKAAKEEYDRLFALAKAKTDLAKAELDYFIANNASKIDAGEKLTLKMLEQEFDRLERIRDKKAKALDDDKAAEIAKAESSAKSAEELTILKDAIDLEYRNKKQALDLELEKSTDALVKQYNEEQKQLKLEQLQADNELAIAEAATKAEADKLKQEQDYQAELERYRKMYQDKKITDSEYQRFKDAAKKKQDEMDRVRELQQLQGTLGGLNQVAGAIGEMFGQSKELAIVQAGINGAMAVTSILAQYPKFDGGFAMWAAIAAAGITTIAQVGKIMKAKPPKQPKFWEGGHTGTAAALGFDEYGPVTGYVHKNEWVAPEFMTQSPRYAATFTWLENERKRGLKGYFNGGETTTGTVGDATPGSPTSTDETNTLMRAVLYYLQNPVSPNLLFGYAEAQKVNALNTESQQSQQNGIVS